MNIVSKTRISEGLEVVTDKAIYRIIPAWAEGRHHRIVRDGWDLMRGVPKFGGYIEWEWSNRYSKQKHALSALKEWNS